MFYSVFGLITRNSNCKMSQSLSVFGTLKAQNNFHFFEEHSLLAL